MAIRRKDGCQRQLCINGDSSGDTVIVIVIVIVAVAGFGCYVPVITGPYPATW